MVEVVPLSIEVGGNGMERRCAASAKIVQRCAQADASGIAGAVIGPRRVEPCHGGSLVRTERGSIRFPLTPPRRLDSACVNQEHDREAQESGVPAAARLHLEDVESA